MSIRVRSPRALRRKLRSSHSKRVACLCAAFERGAFYELRCVALCATPLPRDASLTCASSVARPRVPFLLVLTFPHVSVVSSRSPSRVCTCCGVCVLPQRHVSRFLLWDIWCCLDWTLFGACHPFASFAEHSSCVGCGMRMFTSSRNHSYVSILLQLSLATDRNTRTDVLRIA